MSTYSRCSLVEVLLYFLVKVMYFNETLPKALDLTAVCNNEVTDECMICCLYIIQGGIFGVGQSTAKVYNKETSIKIRFK